MAIDTAAREQLLDSVRRYVAGRLRPLEDIVAEANAVPESVVQEMRELGLFGLSIPEEYGGLALSMEDECRVAIELGHTSPAFRSNFGTNVGIGSQGLVQFGNPVQKQRWLPRIARGELITSFALTEPEAGSDAASVRTCATRHDDCYVLNGLKRYITNADRADLFTVIARTRPGDCGRDGITAFLVPSDLPGVRLGKPERKMGQHGANVCDVIFDEVRVPLENRLGDEGAGLRLAFAVLDRGRLHIAAFCVGVAERLIDDCVTHARTRKQFGKALAEMQLIQAMLADSKTETLAARALTLETARQYDDRTPIRLEVAACKLFASEMVGRVADRAVQIFGGAGYVAGNGIERLYRDVRLFRITDSAYLKTAFVYNLRYPGQYYDSETGLNYNMARDYDPQTGRYVESDPVGLNGGISTYAYVGGSPIIYVDPFGLCWQFSQSTGVWSHVDDVTGEVVPVGVGFSGQGTGYNTPWMQFVKNTGPLPAGLYSILPGRTWKGMTNVVGNWNDSGGVEAGL